MTKKSLWGLGIIAFSFVSIPLIPNIAECFVWTFDGELSLLIFLILFLLGWTLFVLGFKNWKSRLSTLIISVLVLILVILAVISSLGTTRQKATGAATKATMSSMRSEAERIVIEGKNLDDWHYPENICDQNLGSLNILFSATRNYGANGITCFVSPNFKDYAISAGLPLTGHVRKSSICKDPLFKTEAKISNEFYCIDSTGFAGNVTGSITGPSCEPVKVNNHQ